MKRRNPTFSSQEDIAGLKGFDDYQIKLGDLMRGERATLGKSLLDVQRELRIKASYISAIENCDSEAFDTPSFIAGYVKSYAKYLGMNPTEVFDKFCAESGFSASYGISSKQQTKKLKTASTEKYSGSLAAGLSNSRFAPPQQSFGDHIDARAIGSTVIMAALVMSISFGAWSVLKEVQRVQVAPVENTPLVLSDLDPIDQTSAVTNDQMVSVNSEAPSGEYLDRLYRPQALEVPILVSRDAPISALDPSLIGNFKPMSNPALPDSKPAKFDNIGLAEVLENTSQNFVPKVLEDAPPKLALFAVRPAWVQVKAADGSTIFERIMNPGEEFVLPQSEIAPKLRAGMSGSLYFAVNGSLYGPAGDGAKVVKQIPLSVDSLQQTYQLADIDTDPQLQKVVAEAQFSSFKISTAEEQERD